MNTESCAPKIKVHLKLAKFDGEYVEGATPVEIIEREYEFSTQDEAFTYLEGLNHGND